MSKSYSVPQLAEHWGVNQSKIIGWIRRGELRAVNIAASPLGRKPRWRIMAEAVEAFEEARSSKPVVAIERRRSPKREPGFVEYF